MSDKLALVTGGSRGIGHGIAQSLSQEGWNLLINGRREYDEVKSVVEGLGNGSNIVKYIQGDISVEADRNRIVQEAMVQFGQINLLVNNAGIAPRERNDLLNMSEESYDRVMKINLKGPFFLTQAVASEMIRLSETDPNYFGAIVSISSISATVASTNRGQYCISKAGIGMMTQLYASRLGAFNIPVYEVRPGIIDTDMTAAVRGKYDDLFRRGLAIQARWGQSEDVGKVVAALARGDLAYSTGQVIMVDGGMTLQRL